MRAVFPSVLILSVCVGVAAGQEKKKVDEAWVEKVSALKPDEQSKAIAAKLHELNRFEKPDKVTFVAEEGKIVEFTFDSSGVMDITPLKVLKHLRKLNANGYQPASETDKDRITDLSVLKGMPLVEVRINWAKVTDLSPLRGMQLKAVDLMACPIETLAPLEGMPLEYVNAYSTKISTLLPLKGAPD